MKKKNYLWSMLAMMIVGLLSVGLSSCSDDKEDDKVSVSQTSVSFGDTGGTQSVQVLSNTKWTVSGAPNWLTVAPPSGSGNGMISITANANTSSTSQNCTLFITAGSASATVSVSQTGKDENDVVGTTWEEVHRYSDGSTYVTSLSFTTSTARLTFTYTEGTTSTTENIEYTYKRTNNIVVLSPVEAGKAVMEGRIESGAKMILTNTSNGSEVAVLYKK